MTLRSFQDVIRLVLCNLLDQVDYNCGASLRELGQLDDSQISYIGGKLM